MKRKNVWGRGREKNTPIPQWGSRANGCKGNSGRLKKRHEGRKEKKYA